MSAASGGVTPSSVTPSSVTSDRAFKAGLKALAAADADLARALAAHGHPPFRRIAPGYAALLRILIGQQVSTQSAAAIWRKLTEALGPEPTAGAMLIQSEETLRGFGFSRQKIAYGLGLAREIDEGRLDLDGLASLGDEDAIRELVRVKGIGRWTAEVYLLFALGRRDILPAADLALAIAYQRVKKLDARPDPRRLAALAEPWKPWRGAVAHLLWHVYKQPL